MLRPLVAGAVALCWASYASAQQEDSPFRYLRPTVAPAPHAAASGGQDGATINSTDGADETAASAPVEAAPPATVLIAPPAPEGGASVPSPPSADGAPDVSRDGGIPPEPSVPAEPAKSEPARALRLGVLAPRDVAGVKATLEPMIGDLTQALGNPVEILPMASYGAMVDAQLQRRIDGGFYSAASFALVQASCGCLQPIAAPAATDGTRAYHAVIVARRDAGIATVADLKGKTVAVAAQDSIGGRRMQLAGLLAEGVDVEGLFAGVRAVGSPQQAVQLLAAGEVDAAFAWSSLSGDPERGFSRGTLADLAAQGDFPTDRFAIVWRSRPIAHGPVAVLKNLPDAEKSALTNYLVTLSEAQPDAYDRLSPYYAGGFAAVDAKDYAGLAILVQEKVDDLQLPLVTGAPKPP
jgi:phosphonate transport system substrate-binding protein